MIAPTTVFLIHSGGLGAAQWRRVAQILGARWTIVAPDLRGYGEAPPLDVSDGALPAPDQDLALLLAHFDALSGPVHVVGHSYGGLLAARLAFARPKDVCSLALFEPVLRGVLRSTGDAEALSNSYLWSREAPGSVPWVQAFVDYWGGAGAFGRLSPPVRDAFLAARHTIAAEVAGIGDDQTPLEAYAALSVPTLVARGEHTTLASRRICDALARKIPNVRLEVVAGAGHMAPVSHPNEASALLTELWRQALETTPGLRQSPP